MATRTEYRGGNSAAAEREHHRGSPWHQAMRFAGLFFSPLVGVAAAGLIHFWIGGVHLHTAQGDLDIGSHALWWLIGTELFVLLAAGLTTWLAWEFAEHRKIALRSSLAGSVAAVGAVFALIVLTGPGYRTAGVFIIVAWSVAVIWSIARLDVTRNDKQTEQREDTFLDKHLKGWKTRKVTHEADENGDPLSTTIHFQHADGDTFDQLSDTVPNMESASGSPAGLSYATPTDEADRSSVTVMHQDPLKRIIEIPPPPYEGGSIQNPLLVGKYANGQYVWAHLAGGDGFSPTSYIHMGMNRTGKTQSAESVSLTDVISRRDVVILYLNKAKGLQDVRCIIPGVEAALIADGDETTGLYREALAQLKRMLGYRQRIMGLYGIHEWNPQQCWDNPPWRTNPDTGKREQMERLPFLIAHFAEADAILADDRGDATFVVSKGLSVGICTGWSLQRADATKMPTGLRFNIGTAWCFGCGDEDSASMALSAWVVKAGAHPERWGQRKPGYFYFEGLGVDESLFVVPARGFGEGPDGAELRAELLARNLRNAPRMAKLDRGSALATGTWWDDTAKATDELRARLLQLPAPQTAPQTPAPQPVPDDPQTHDDDEERKEMEREVRETTHVEGIDLYPPDPDTGERAAFEDAKAPVPHFEAGQEMTWEDDRPSARDRAAALLEFGRSLEELMGRADLRDPADPTGGTVIVTVDLMAKTYGYRSRPFFSETLRDVSAGKISQEQTRTNLILTFAPDLAKAGTYRIQRPTSGHAG